MASPGMQPPVRILLITYYFPPDLGAGSFRAEALAKALVSNGRNVTLDIITSEPNRYRSHRPVQEDNESKSYMVNRIYLPDVSSGLVGQIRCYMEFARKATASVTFDNYDIVVATSSRLMTACLGARVAKKVGARLYLDIRDIFVETFNDIYPSTLLKPMKFVLERIESWAVGRADRINLVSRGFLPYFQKRFNHQDFRFFTNGVDEPFATIDQKPLNHLPSAELGQRLNVVYAGNIGDGQGLDKIIPELALNLFEVAHFTIVGDGGTKQKLLDRCQEIGAQVTFMDPVPRHEINKIYQSADVLFLHLNNMTAFTRVLPSKLFEYAATKKPILAGVSGYSCEFILENIKGVTVFEPCNLSQATKAFENLELSCFDRSTFIEKFSRKKIMKEMASDILSLVKGAN